MMQNKISVLVTFFNQAQYVDDCLKSIMEQETDFPFCVIIGDDGSTDRTIDKIIEWESRYPSKIHHIIQPREAGKKYIGGIRASQNRLSLLKEVNTPYFTFLDGDDYWTDKKKLQKQIDILDNPENDDCDSCGHFTVSFNEKVSDDIIYIPPKTWKEGKISFRRYWEDLYVHSDSIVFRSRRIKELDFSLLDKHFNDNVITFCFLQNNKMYFIPEVMASYRVTENSIYNGEKESIGAIRGIFDYDLEIKMIPGIRKIASRRHLHDFLYIQSHRHEMRKLLEYKKIAMEDDLPTACHVVDTGYIFKESDLLDRIEVLIIRIERQFVKLNNALNK